MIASKSKATPVAVTVPTAVKAEVEAKTSEILIDKFASSTIVDSAISDKVTLPAPDALVSPMTLVPVTPERPAPALTLETPATVPAEDTPVKADVDMLGCVVPTAPVIETEFSVLLLLCVCVTVPRLAFAETDEIVLLIFSCTVPIEPVAATEFIVLLLLCVCVTTPMLLVDETEVKVSAKFTEGVPTAEVAETLLSAGVLLVLTLPTLIVPETAVTDLFTFSFTVPILPTAKTEDTVLLLLATLIIFPIFTVAETEDKITESPLSNTTFATLMVADTEDTDLTAEEDGVTVPILPVADTEATILLLLCVCVTVPIFALALTEESTTLRPVGPASVENGASENALIENIVEPSVLYSFIYFYLFVK